MRVVADSNIVVSRYLVAAGPAARILAAWRDGAFELIVSPALVAEYSRVLNYPRIQRRHGMSPEQITDELTDLRAFAILVEPSHVPAVIASDPDDDQVLAAAVAGEADYIVSGDDDLLALKQYQGIRILTPRMFLALLEQEGYLER